VKTFVFVAILIALLPTAVVAQSDSDYGQRLQGANGWLLPVATKILGSDEHKHLGRGSVNAWDLVAPNGSAIYAMTTGTVEYAGCGNQGGYGCWVLLKHSGGYTSAYGHMINGSIRVQRGQTVDANTLLGQVGWTGMTSFGPHTHFEIRQGGKFQSIRNYFSIDAMKQCNLCSVGGKPVAAQGVRTVGAASAGVALPQLSGVYLLVFGAFGLLSLVYILSGRNKWLQHCIYHGAMMYTAVVTLLLAGAVPMGSLPTVTASQPAVIGGDAWKIAYAAMRKYEGATCVHDPGRTLKGVTQTTYNAWRKGKGLPTADVCTSLTEQEAETIYYERYWLTSGADKLPKAVAITVFDFAVNAGTGQSNKALAQCGANVKCINDYRENFYRNARSFALYGRGWLNRLSFIRSITEG